MSDHYDTNPTTPTNLTGKVDEDELIATDGAEGGAGFWEDVTYWLCPTGSCRRL